MTHNFPWEKIHEVLTIIWDTTARDWIYHVHKVYPRENGKVAQRNLDNSCGHPSYLGNSLSPYIEAG